VELSKNSTAGGKEEATTNTFDLQEVGKENMRKIRKTTGSAGWGWIII